MPHRTPNGGTPLGPDGAVDARRTYAIRGESAAGLGQRNLPNEDDLVDLGQLLHNVGIHIRFGIDEIVTNLAVGLVFEGMDVDPGASDNPSYLGNHAGDVLANDHQSHPGVGGGVRAKPG